MSTPGTDGVPQHAAPASPRARLVAWVMAVVAPRAKALAAAAVTAAATAVLPVLVSGGGDVALVDWATGVRAAIAAVAGGLLVYLAPANRPAP